MVSRFRYFFFILSVILVLSATRALGAVPEDEAHFLQLLQSSNPEDQIDAALGLGQIQSMRGVQLETLIAIERLATDRRHTSPGYRARVIMFFHRSARSFNEKKWRWMLAQQHKELRVDSTVAWAWTSALRELEGYRDDFLRSHKIFRPPPLYLLEKRILNTCGNVVAFFKRKKTG